MKTDALICVSGTDGTGKSTLVKALARALPGSKAVSIWDLMRDSRAQTVFASRASLDTLLAMLTPDARTLLCASGLKEAYDRAGSGVRVVDAHWYKFMATELALGADPALAGKMARLFPQPALTFQLALSPRVAAERKQGSYTAYECGMAEPTFEGFVQFQSRTVELVRQLAVADGRKVVTLDAALPVERLCAQALHVIRAELAAPDDVGLEAR